MLSIVSLLPGPITHADTGGGGFKRYFEEIVGVLKKHFPDVIIDREIVEVRASHCYHLVIDSRL